jgi:hypothetical protein
MLDQQSVHESAVHLPVVTWHAPVVRMAWLTLSAVQRNVVAATYGGIAWYASQSM